MFTDEFRTPKSEFRNKQKPEGIIITHSVDLFLKNEVISAVEFDKHKPSFDVFSKYTWESLKLYRFPSHYFIEQVGNEVCTIVGTGAHLRSSFLYEYIAPSGILDNFIFIVMAGNFNKLMPNDDMYIRLGNIITSILYTYKMSGKSSNVFTLEDIISMFTLTDVNPKLDLQPMKFFKMTELRSNIY